MTAPEASAGDAAAVASGGLICLDISDNVLVATRTIAAGEEFMIDGEPVSIEQSVPLGYKVARRHVGTGDRAVRYGMPIGRFVAPAAPGELVHVHNLVSDYIPSTRRGGHTAP